MCEPECPAEAIKPDTENAIEQWAQINRDYALTWPNITKKGEAPADAKEWDGVANKFKDHFSANPAKR